MLVTVIGVGYVGLVTGTCLAEMGHQVHCVDIDEVKITHLRQGVVPFFEPGIEELIKRNLKEGRLFFSTSYEKVSCSQFCFIAVDTPATIEGYADLSQVQKVATTIGNHMNDYLVVINKSTVPVGTARFVKDLIDNQLAKREVDISYDVVSNPEFLKEGDAVNDFMKPDRIIIGSKSPKAIELMRQLYAPFIESYDKMVVMDCASAELAKYASNAMLASRISLMNELAEIAAAAKADIDMIRLAVGADQRIGNKFLYAGCGFGGSCLPKDLKALSRQAHQLKVETPLLEAIEGVNERQKRKMGLWIEQFFCNQGGIEGRQIAILGLAFKPGTDDIRSAPSLTLIEQLLGLGCKLKLYDPIAKPKMQRLFSDESSVSFCANEYEAVDQADATVVLTEWKQFCCLDLNLVKKLMKGDLFCDGRNLYDPILMASLGFNYRSFGRPCHPPLSIDIERVTQMLKNEAVCPQS